jgi:hypothetical protein
MEMCIISARAEVAQYIRVSVAECWTTIPSRDGVSRRRAGDLENLCSHRQNAQVTKFGVKLRFVTLGDLINLIGDDPSYSAIW